MTYYSNTNIIHYINLSTFLFGFYWVVTISEIGTNGFNSDSESLKWWNVLILISLAISILYCFYLHILKEKYINFRYSLLLSKKIVYFTILASLLLIISCTVGFKEIKDDINSNLFSTIFFSSCGGYGLVLFLILIYCFRNWKNISHPTNDGSILIV
jgi:hypothetical protein